MKVACTPSKNVGQWMAEVERARPLRSSEPIAT